MSPSPKALCLTLAQQLGGRGARHQRGQTSGRADMTRHPGARAGPPARAPRGRGRLAGSPNPRAGADRGAEAAPPGAPVSISQRDGANLRPTHAGGRGRSAPPARQARAPQPPARRARRLPTSPSPGPRPPSALRPRAAPAPAPAPGRRLVAALTQLVLGGGGGGRSHVAPRREGGRGRRGSARPGGAGGSRLRGAAAPRGRLRSSGGGPRGAHEARPPPPPTASSSPRAAPSPPSPREVATAGALAASRPCGAAAAVRRPSPERPAPRSPGSRRLYI